MSKALVFSGQGSQYVGMLRDICEKYPLADTLVEKANDILGYELSKIMFEGPIDLLKETRYTQPAIYLHSSIICSLIKDKLDFSFTAGHSVGEYAALFASGVIAFEDGLKLVAKRGELMFTAGLDKPGTMFAIINLEDEKVERICNDLTDIEKDNIVVPANYNSPGQIVVSGSADYLRNNIGAFKEAGARLVKELIVSGAFHSPLLNSAKEELRIIINSTKFNNTKTPIISNVYAAPLTNSDEIKNALIQQLTSPVKWTQSILKMKNLGINEFTEIGPGNVLQGLIKRTITDIKINGIDKSEDLENYK